MASLDNTEKWDGFTLYKEGGRTAFRTSPSFHGPHSNAEPCIRQLARET